jgi:hypothetical protein
MEAKEKAKELFWKFRHLENKKSFIDNDNSKKCVLIAINELIDEAYFTDGYFDRQEYWE